MWNFAVKSLKPDRTYSKSPSASKTAMSRGLRSYARVPTFWIEKPIRGKLFLSGALIDAQLAAKIDVDFG